MRPSEITLGTQVRIHIPVMRDVMRDGEVVGSVFARSVCARGVVADDSFEDDKTYYKVVVQNGNPMTAYKNDNGELWLEERFLTPYVSRSKTPPQTVRRRREARREWNAARDAKIAEGKAVDF